MSNLGTYLREAREQAGLSIQELASRTKIREPLLEAIERGDFKRLPAGVVGRGFLRAYAREVGLDPEAIIRQYSAEFEADTPPADMPLHIDETAAELTSSGRGGQLLTAFGLAAAAIVVLFLLPNMGTGPAESPTAVTATAAASSEAVSQAGTASTNGTVTPSAIGTTAAAPHPPLNPDALTLEINPTSEVWVEARADGQQVLYRMVQPNERVVLEARNEFAVRVGDAGAFKYSINGQPGRPLGGPAEVLTVEIARDNVANFVTAPAATIASAPQP